jgi:hypothetical protein
MPSVVAHPMILCISARAIPFLRHAGSVYTFSTSATGLTATRAPSCEMRGSCGWICAPAPAITRSPASTASQPTYEPSRNSALRAAFDLESNSVDSAAVGTSPISWNMATRWWAMMAASLVVACRML